MTTLGKTFLLLTIFSLFVSIYLLQPILMPFLVGMALAYLGDPLVDRLEGLGAGRTTGVFIVFVVVVVIVVFLFGPEIIRAYSRYQMRNRRIKRLHEWFGI